MMMFESTRACRGGILVIATVCFLMGFVFQVLYLSNSQHISLKSKFHLKNNVGLGTNELQRLHDVEEKFADQLKEIDNLKESIERNHNAQIGGVNTKLESSSSSSSSSSSLFLSHVTDDVVPNIVKAWRKAKLDWHAMLPVHNSIWERYGTPEKGKGLRLLVSKEIQVTNFLTQFHESGLSAKYGKNHGTLSEYSACNSFLSTCMIHDSTKCQVDQLCNWSKEKQLCEDRSTGDMESETATSCVEPSRISPGGTVERTDPAGCVFYVHQPVVFVDIDSESQSMFYHWWASWSTIVHYWRNQFKSSRSIHFFLSSINDPMFFDYFGLISDNCWRRSTSSFVQSPKGACYCDVRTLHVGQSRTDPTGSANQMIEYLNITKVMPPIKKIKIGIISRRLKRFILNEYELVAAVEKMGFLCVLLPLETMTMYEQMNELRSLDVLIGIHGSALDNSVFLHKGENDLTYCTCALI